MLYFSFRKQAEWLMRLEWDCRRASSTPRTIWMAGKLLEGLHPNISETKSYSVCLAAHTHAQWECCNECTCCDDSQWESIKGQNIEMRLRKWLIENDVRWEDVPIVSEFPGSIDRYDCVTQGWVVWKWLGPPTPTIGASHSLYRIKITWSFQWKCFRS